MTDLTETDISERIKRLEEYQFGAHITLPDVTGLTGGVDVLEDDSMVLSGATGLDFGANVDTTVPGDGTVTVDVDLDSVSTYTDEQAQDAVGTNAGPGMAYDDANGEVGLNVIDSGSVTLASGTATIDTGVASTETATFFPALGPATDDAKVAADIVPVSGGNYEVHIDETDTSVGNPSVEYDIIRVR